MGGSEHRKFRVTKEGPVESKSLRNRMWGTYWSVVEFRAGLWVSFELIWTKREFYFLLDLI